MATSKSAASVSLSCSNALMREATVLATTISLLSLNDEPDPVEEAVSLGDRMRQAQDVKALATA